MSSGETVSGLSLGSHIVDYQKIDGWDAPKPIMVTVKLNQTTKITGKYIRQIGTLKVTITPEAAVNGGARWRVADTTDWTQSGRAIQLPVGSYTVQFKSLTGWKKPEDKEVVIENGKVKSVTGKYTF